MSEDAPPPYYFRIKDNGALVFRVDTANPRGRLDMAQIATVNANNGQVKAQGDTDLTPGDQAAIAEWLATRRADLAARDLDDIHRTVERLNLAAQWAQSKATAEDLDAVTDALLLAMHDLRSVLVRKRAGRASQ